ncbi:MAG: ABC transporter permease [Acidisphaera sp.]|nr:ABC transporter permease [Acidisphaera sp.]
MTVAATRTLSPARLPGLLVAAPLLLLLPGVALILALFAYPLLRLVVQSVTDPEPNLDSYRSVLQDPTLWLIIRTTLVVAAECTALTLLLAYPLGFLLSRMPRRWANRLLLLVLLPFWTSLLVRMYAWMVLLGSHGVINEALVGSGLLAHPLPLLYNRFAVLIGMSHYMLPFMVLSLYSTMLSIDRSLLEAAGTMGSSLPQTFFRIYLPLSMPGVYAGCLLVFILSMGFYITPALLGSPQDTTIAVYIQQQIELLNWADGTAMAVVLIAIIGALFVLYDRLLGFNRLLALGPS